MAKVLEMPKLSPTMEEGQISAWHKEEGEPIEVDDLLAEVETDKATMEYRSFDKGTLLRILAPMGSVVRLGQPVAILGEPNEDVSALLTELGVVDEEAPAEAEKDDKNKDENKDEDKDEDEEAKTDLGGPLNTSMHAAPPTPRSGGHPATTKASPPGKVDIRPAAPTPRSAETLITATPSRKPAMAPAIESAPPPAPAPIRPTMPVPRERAKASPYVRKLARERELNLDAIVGTGPGGRIVARDLEKIAETHTQPAPQPQQAVAPPVAPPPLPGLTAPEVRPLSMMRKTIARRLVESKQNVPHFYLSIDVDADPLTMLREQINQGLASSKEREAESALKVSYNDLLIKACGIALARVPECNAQFSPDAILIHKRVDISVAVAVADGLVTPVIRDANTKTLLGIAAEVRDLAERSRAKKLRPEEMQGGTFSISNLGMYGIDSFAAVINPPEGAILAVGQVRQEPVVRGDAVVPGRRLAMTLSCDHRVVDGAVGATFLKVLRQLIEHPTQILIM